MAYIQDSTQSFTIVLTAMLEGRGLIGLIQVSNFGSGITYFFEPTNLEAQTGWAWRDGILPEATEADGISISAWLWNFGDAPDTLFAELSGIGTTEPSLQEAPNVPVGYGYEVGFEWNFTMPPDNVNITINAGHVE